MADPRSLFGERRLPQFLGGRRVDYYIPPEVRQGIGGLLAGLEMINPLTGLREYERSMREGDYPAAASEALMLAAPGAGALLARGVGRAVPSAVRAVDDAAEEGSVLLQETLSPVGAIDPRISDAEAFARLEEAYDAQVPEPPYVEAGDTFAMASRREDFDLLNEQYAALDLIDPEPQDLDLAYDIASQIRLLNMPLTDSQRDILDVYESAGGAVEDFPFGTLQDQDFPDPDVPEPDFVDADFADVPEPGVRPAELPSATIFNTPEGGARFYSPALRAVGQLPQEMYGGLDELAAAWRAKGAKPEELRLLEESLYERTELGPQASQRISRGTADQVADEYAAWVSPVVKRFTGGRTDYDDYFTKGGKGYTEVAIGAPPASVGAIDGSIVTDPPDRANIHFDLPSGTVAHYRAARFRTGGNEADAFHVGEVQSDWGQLRGKLFKNEEEAELAQDRRDRYPDERTLEEYEQLDLYATYGTREDFDRKYKGVPYVGSTDKWTQLALKQALIDAANSDARYMTLGTGDMAVAMTRGDLEGQRKYYDEILPKNFKKILQRLASDAGIKAPEIVPRDILVEENRIMVPKTVLSIELTPELRRALSEVGLPSYRDGGLVSLLPM